MGETKMVACWSMFDAIDDRRAYIVTSKTSFFKRKCPQGAWDFFKR